MSELLGSVGKAPQRLERRIRRRRADAVHHRRKQDGISIDAEQLDDSLLAESGDGQTSRFETLKGFLVAGEAAKSYQDAAIQLGISEVGARSAVSRLRQRFRELMRSAIANTVSRPEEIDEEIRYLFEALAD